MSSLIGVIALAAVVALLDIPPLVRKSRKRELFVYIVLLLTATALYSALVMEVKLPNPYAILEIVYKPFK
ncbi:hypothetical protein [Paenibacillus sp. YIM B09110]|uniref:hypothetical protein n=1 Tax=Paenibacillus sp. YIM B09110 TaxID=3126102 RepID=UPI00301BC50A